MSRTVCIIQGHPHGTGKHLCHALADAYAEGAAKAGALVRRVDLGAIDVPVMRDPASFETAPTEAIVAAQEAVKSADHLVVIYPLWLGTMPALVKAFFEQLCRNSFAVAMDAKGGWPRQLLKGKSARVVVTMGMPATAYRLMFGAHGVKGFEQSILRMSGIRPIRETFVGGVGAMSPSRIEALFKRMRKLGEALA